MVQLLYSFQWYPFILYSVGQVSPYVPSDQLINQTTQLVKMLVEKVN